MKLLTTLNIDEDDISLVMYNPEDQLLFLGHNIYGKFLIISSKFFEIWKSKFWQILHLKIWPQNLMFPSWGGMWLQWQLTGILPANKSTEQLASTMTDFPSMVPLSKQQDIANGQFNQIKNKNRQHNEEENAVLIIYIIKNFIYFNILSLPLHSLIGVNIISGFHW